MICEIIIKSERVGSVKSWYGHVRGWAQFFFPGFSKEKLIVAYNFEEIFYWE